MEDGHRLTRRDNLLHSLTDQTGSLDAVQRVAIRVPSMSLHVHPVLSMSHPCHLFTLQHDAILILCSDRKKPICLLITLLVHYYECSALRGPITNT